MAITLSQPPSENSANPTRRQLDELDALLQRMLELPVNKLENVEDGPSAPPPVSYTAPDEPEAPAVTEAPPAPKIDFQALKLRLAARPEVAGSPEGVPAPAPAEVEKDGADSWVPLSSTWQPSSLTWKPLAQSWKQPTDAPQAAEPAAKETPAWEPVPTTEPQPVPSLAHAFRVLNEDLKPLRLPADEQPVVRWAMPLVWFNVVFDVCLMLLGPVGRVLRSRTGRMLIGVLGLGCLVAAAAVLVIDWIGWPS